MHIMLFFSYLYSCQFSFHTIFLKISFFGLSCKVMGFIMASLSICVIILCSPSIHFPHFLSLCQSLFWRHCFEIVNSFINNYANPSTSQGSLFLPSCLHTSWLPQYRCLLFSHILRIPFWHSRVCFHPWSTVQATGRHSWKCGLSISPSHSRCPIHSTLSLCYSMWVLASQDHILTAGLLGKNQHVQNGTGCCLTFFSQNFASRWSEVLAGPYIKYT